MKKNNWEPKGIQAKDLEKKITKGDIKIPNYQRGIVWTDTMQKDLINSLKEGYPFGSLLIYKYDDVSKPLLLIDGLQRSTAIFKFIQNPADFFDETDISDDIVDELIGLINSAPDKSGQRTALKNTIKNWVLGHKTSDDVRNMDPYMCATQIMNQFPTLKKIVFDDEIKSYQTISKIIKPIFDNYKNLCIEVEDRHIPYIEITGSEESLPDIFYRINDRGVKLNKQNKFAASWCDDPIKINGENDKLENIVSLVRKRYDAIEAKGTHIYNYDSVEFNAKKELDIFEIAFGLGKYLGLEYPHLFQIKNDIIAVDSIGFTLINACLNGTKDTLHEMNKNLKKYTDEDINKFILNILSCVKYVDGLLAIVTKFKSNKRIGKGQLHTEFQIVSIIAAIFKLKYYKQVDDELICDLRSISKKWNEYDNKLQKALITNYIYDIVNGVWAGHGDNTLDDIIHNRPETYCTVVTKKAFETSLNSWFETNKHINLVYKAKDVKSPKESDKVLLNLIYVSEFSASKQLDSSKFDIEHLAPKQLVENVLSRFKGELKLPVASFGNLCLLPEYVNRKKKAKILYDDTEYISKLGKKKITINELEEEYAFTSSEDLCWLNDNSLTKDEIAKKYDTFINGRFVNLLKKITDILYENEKSEVDTKSFEKELAPV